MRVTPFNLTILFSGAVARHRVRALLLLSTALVSLASPAFAQAVNVTIDGTAETVIGTGGGTQPHPWSVNILRVGNILPASSLTISAGGIVTNGTVRIGEGPTGDGAVTVTGANSQLNNFSQFRVGDRGKGTLTIEAGGKVTNSSGLVGYGPTGDGTVTVTGVNSEWQNYGGLRVGRAGKGTLTIEAGGTVTNTGGNVGIAPSGIGTVTVTGTSSLWQNSTLVALGRNGQGTLTIADGGEVRVNLGAGVVNIATNAGSTGIVNIGAAAGSAAVAAGTLTAGTVVFGAGTGKLVFNHTDMGLNFAPLISGAGAVEIHAGHTIFAGIHTYTGGTTISGGKLTVNGAIAGDVTVDGGTLGGTGMIGGIVIMAGGTLAPGNSIGTTNVGNATLANGSAFAVEVNSAGASDLLNATGTVTIDPGVTVNVLAENGTDDGSTYNASTTYTIVTATGGVVGTFTTLTENFAFLDGALTYDANNAYLTLTRNDVTLAAVAATPAQTATANALEDVSFSNPARAALAVLSAADATKALAALSGEAHASIKGVLATDSRFTRNAALNRIREAFVAANAAAAPLEDGQQSGSSTYGTALNAITHSFAPVAWAHAIGSWANQSATANNAATNREVAGFLMGVDTLTFNNWRFGLLGGYTHTNLSISSLTSNANVETYRFGAYGGTSFNGLGLRFGGDYSWHSLATSRAVVFPGLANQLSANYDAATAQIYAEASYRLTMGKINFDPFANAAYVYQQTDGFTETGGAAALTSASSTMATTFTTLGLRAEARLFKRAKIHGSVGWRHAFGDTGPRGTFAFAGGNNFTVTGMPIARDAAIMEAGLNAQLADNINLDISYIGQLASGISDHGGKAKLVVKF